MPDDDVLDIQIAGNDHLSPAQQMRIKELVSLLAERKSTRKALRDEQGSLKEKMDALSAKVKAADEAVSKVIRELKSLNSLD